MYSKINTVGPAKIGFCNFNVQLLYTLYSSYQSHSEVVQNSLFTIRC